MKKIYVYPALEKNSLNPYIENLKQSLSKHYIVVNQTFLPNKGQLYDLIVNSRSSDIVYLNWIESLSVARFGFLQSVVFILYFLYLKLKGVKVVNMVHNKFSHNKNVLTKIIFFFVNSFSDAVFTHSSEGVDFTKSHSLCKDVNYFPHPFSQACCVNKDNIRFDVLIWGTVLPYKGVYDFLKYLKDNSLLSRYNIAIIGRVMDSRVLDILSTDKSHKIFLKDEIVPKSELYEFIASSKRILFTYLSNSVLSSGALIDSIESNSLVLGPDIAAFKDLRQLGLLNTYTSYSNLISYLDLDPCDYYLGKSFLQQTVNKYSWDSFADFLISKIE